MSETALSIDAIFCAALEIASSDERAAYLARACEGDAELRRRVEELLQAHFKAGSFLLDAPPLGLGATVEMPRIAEGPATLIGPYKLLEQIGEGGFGIVYMADQQAPVRRRVALKIIKPGMDTRQVLARFEAERQALALMDHPNIARALDAGATDSGRPYFVMELVRGISITDYCDQNNLAVHERLDLFVQVCHAVQHAHQKGIIHRDIKPSNVLVTMQDGRPVPKVIDFGVAKAINQQLTQETIFTRFAEMIGTPLYMSPEQAEISSLDIDTRSDIYSLGVLLYELLTGSTPFEKQRLKQAAFDEIRRIIREEEPLKPSTRISSLGENSAVVAAHRHADPRRLGQLMRGDLDWIVMKALEKDRTRRYETANGLAMDIQRHLADEPVLAGPPSAVYRFRKFARRNRASFATAVVVSAALVLGIVGTTWQAIRARDARQLAEDRREDAEQAREAEKDQRLLAEANLRKAQEAVDKYFTTVSESKLLNVPGMVPLRKELLHSALEYYQGFSEQQTDDPTSLADLAVTELRVVQIMYWNGDHGDQFFPHMQKGIEILEQLVREGRDTPDVQRRVAGFLQSNPEPPRWEGGSNFDRRLLHDVLLRGTKLWEKFVRDNPGASGFQSDLAGLNTFIADNCISDNRPNEAIPFAERARVLWEKLVMEHPEEPRYRLDLARFYDSKFMAGSGNAGKQSAGKAREIFEQLVAEFPHVPVYRIWLGSSFQTEGKSAASQEEAERAFAKAVDQFQKVAAEFPTVLSCRKDLAVASLQLADTMTNRGKNAEALELYRQSVNIFETLAAESPDYQRTALRTEALFKLSARLIAAGREQEADEFSRKARESMPSDAGGLNGIAWGVAKSQVVQVDDGKWAVELAQKAVELDPQAGYCWSTLGTAHYRAGDWKAAIAVLEKSMELRNGGDGYDWFFLAMAHWQLGEKDSATKWYQIARLGTAKFAPQNEELARFRAEAAALMGLPETEPTTKTDDIALGELLVELRPQATSYRIRGEAFANSEQWDRAEKDFVKAIELGDKFFFTWYERALVRRAKGDKPGFQAACAEMLKQFPFTEETDTAHFVAWTCALGPDALAEFFLAVASAGRAAKKDANSAMYAGGLGAILYRAGRFDEARQKLEEADRLSSATDTSRSPPAYTWFFLAMTHQRLGNADEAKQWLDKARDATDKALNEHDAGSIKLTWNRRLTLRLLRSEAETLLGMEAAPGAVAAISPTNDEAPVEAKKP